MVTSGGAPQYYADNVENILSKSLPKHEQLAVVQLNGPKIFGPKPITYFLWGCQTNGYITRPDSFE